MKEIESNIRQGINEIGTAIRRAKVALKPQEARQFFDDNGNSRIVVDPKREAGYPHLKTYDEALERDTFNLMSEGQISIAKSLGLL